MPRILNLNNYVTTTDENQATLKIVPLMNADGSQNPPMFFIGKKSKRFVLTLENKDETVWHRKIIIDHTGTPKEYIQLVDWWFEHAQKDQDYVEQVQKTFKHINNLTDHIIKAHGWLDSESAYHVDGNGKYPKRKKELGKFLQNWLNRSLERQMSRG